MSSMEEECMKSNVNVKQCHFESEKNTEQSTQSLPSTEGRQCEKTSREERTEPKGNECRRKQEGKRVHCKVHPVMGEKNRKIKSAGKKYVVKTVTDVMNKELALCVSRSLAGRSRDNEQLLSVHCLYFFPLPSSLFDPEKLSLTLSYSLHSCLLHVT